MSKLEQLRDVLSGEPDGATWRRVIALFDDWGEDQDLEVGLDYARQHLDASWPDEVRAAPSMWLDVLMGGSKNAESGRRWKRGERAHPALSICRVLAFRGTGVTKKKLAHLKKADHLGELRHLVANRLYAEAVAPLADAGKLGGLTRIDVSQSRLTPAAVGDLARLCGPSLEALDLSETGADAEGLAAFFAAADLSGLTELSLARNPLGAAAIEALASAALPGLRRLDLEQAGLGAEGAAALAQLDAPALERLDLGLNGIGGDGLEALGRAAWGRLAHLDLDGNGLAPADLSTLRRLARGLTGLSVGYNDLGSAGVARLEEAELTALERLELPDSALDDEAVGALDFARFPALKTLSVRWNRLSESGQAGLKEKAPEGVEVDVRWNRAVRR